MSLLSRLNHDTSGNEAFSKITNFLAKIENNFYKKGRESQISTPFIGGHRPGGSCVKIGVQTVVLDLFLCNFSDFDVLCSN